MDKTLKIGICQMVKFNNCDSKHTIEKKTKQGYNEKLKNNNLLYAIILSLCIFKTSHL